MGQKQTCAAHKPMSAKCQQRTFQLSVRKARLAHTLLVSGKMLRLSQRDYFLEIG